jgi:hypothetical protein
MRRTASALLLATSALFLACQDATSPDITNGPSLGKSGQGSLRARGATNHSGDFRAHFNARSGPTGGNARGTWYYRQGPKGHEVRQVADVICLSITDNTALIGLRFTNRTTDPSHPAGSTALLVVQDNGKANHRTSPDLWGFAAGSCNQLNPNVTLASWPGNIRVGAKGVGDHNDDGNLMVTPSDATVNVGDQLQLSATFTNGDNDDDDDGPFTWITSDASIATVDANGLVTGVANGTATITATSGHFSAMATITVVTPPPPPATVNVTVFESGGGPIAGATVTITYTAGSPSPVSGPTDGNGQISFANQPFGVSATVAVVLNDGRTASQAFTGGFASGPNTVQIFVAAATTGSVSGVVTAAADGSALANVDVSLRDGSGGLIAGGLTAADGSYSFTGIAGGTYTLTFTRAGYQTLTVSVTVTGGVNTQDAALTVVATPTDATLNITVTMGGSPLAAALVQLTLSDGNTVTDVTDANGFLSFSNLPVGSVTIDVADPFTGDLVASRIATLVSGVTTVTITIP